MVSEGSAASNGEQTRSCSQELESRLEFENGKKKQEDSALSPRSGLKWINSASQSFTTWMTWMTWRWQQENKKRMLQLKKERDDWLKEQQKKAPRSMQH